MNHDAPETLYLITSEGVVLLKTDGYLNRAQGDPASVEAEVLAVPDWWQYVRPTGAAETAVACWPGVSWIRSAMFCRGAKPDVVNVAVAAP